MKVALIGGHLAPALAVIDAASRDVEFVFFGRKYTMEGDRALSLEYRTIHELGIPFFEVTTGRLQRNFSFRTIVYLLKTPWGMRRCLRQLREQKPDVVIGFGGYVSVPVCFAAHLLRIPVIIHEQTLGAGVANKFIAKFATKICLSWQQSAVHFPKTRVVVTGNPLRKYIKANSEWRMANGKLPVIYITGGSTGAHAINALIGGCLEQLLAKYQLIHQTGDSKEFRDFDKLSALQSRLNPTLQERYTLTKFVPPAEVGGIMQQADLVISRAGINTVTELLYFGRPCFLIPLPHGQKREQLTNAQFLKKTGIGDYVHQADLTPELLVKKIAFMLENKTKYLSHAHEAKSLIRSDAASLIMKVAYEVANRKK